MDPHILPVKGSMTLQDHHNHLRRLVHVEKVHEEEFEAN